MIFEILEVLKGKVTMQHRLLRVRQTNASRDWLGLGALDPLVLNGSVLQQRLRSDVV